MRFSLFLTLLGTFALSAVAFPSHGWLKELIEPLVKKEASSMPVAIPTIDPHPESYDSFVAKRADSNNATNYGAVKISNGNRNPMWESEASQKKTYCFWADAPNSIWATDVDVNADTICYFYTVACDPGKGNAPYVIGRKINQPLPADQHYVAWGCQPYSVTF